MHHDAGSDSVRPGTSAYCTLHLKVTYDPGRSEAIHRKYMQTVRSVVLIGVDSSLSHSWVSRCAEDTSISGLRPSIWEVHNLCAFTRFSWHDAGTLWDHNVSSRGLQPHHAESSLLTAWCGWTELIQLYCWQRRAIGSDFSISAGCAIRMGKQFLVV